MFGADWIKVDHRLIWMLTVGAGAGLMAGAAALDVELPGSLHALFWYTLLVTVACALAALGLLAVARRNELPELGILAAGLYTISVLPMVHGLTLPGVLYGPNPTTMFAVLIGLPGGIAVTAPILSGNRRLRDRVLFGWKPYTTGAIAITSLISVLLLARPDLPPLLGPRQPGTLLVASVGVGGALAVGLRQADLYAVGRRPASLVASAGWSFVGMASLVWLVDEQMGLAVWTAHVLDGVGVLLAAGGLLLAYRQDRGLAEVFAPVLNHDPVIALRLGVTPQVDAFLTSLRDKDAQTRGHVVRVAEMAMTLGVRAGFRGERLRTLGLAALMHDIGKIGVDGEILTKTGPLTDHEYEQMKLHTVIGEQMLAEDSLLRPASRLVRSHHERVDGHGYPDGLSGDEVALDIGIIAVCDAWDAMVQTRHYRAAMTELDARRILAEHSGTQWPRAAVDLLLTELDEGWELRGVFAGVGAPGHSSAGHEHAVVCAETVAGLV